MDFKEFTTRAEQDIRAALEDASPGVGVGMNQVEKLQGESYTAITLTPEGTNIGMNLNLNQLYDRMQHGESYDSILQAAVDQAQKSGADYIIAIGHLPYSDTGLTASPYSPASIIKNTSGINAFIQSGTHRVTVGEKVTDKDGNTVLISSAGSGLSHIGQLVISGNKTGFLSLKNVMKIIASTSSEPTPTNT